MDYKKNMPLIIIAVLAVIAAIVWGMKNVSGNSMQNPSGSSPVGGVGGSSGNAASATPTRNPEKPVTVTLTAVGFQPATVNIKAGATVTWINKSGTDATVNSDPHPTHELYPPLNLGIFHDGQSISLTFHTPGTYGYHNHLRPSQKGTVNVLIIPGV